MSAAPASAAPAVAAAAGGKKARKPVGPLVTAYLLAYNLLAAAAWSYVLFLIGMHLAADGSIYTLYAPIHRALYFAQSLAILEVLHAMLGFVPSPVATTALQVASRLMLVWGIFYPVPESRTTLGFFLATLSWSLVEVPRYSFYALSLVSTPSYAAKFVRYSLFLVLYPSGISGEVLSILSALPLIQSRKLWSYPMPNNLNFAFDYGAFCYFILATYVPGSYIMYNYMLTQRKKQLKPSEDAKKSQ